MANQAESNKSSARSSVTSDAPNLARTADKRWRPSSRKPQFPPICLSVRVHTGRWSPESDSEIHLACDPQPPEIFQPVGTAGRTLQVAEFDHPCRRFQQILEYIRRQTL